MTSRGAKSDVPLSVPDRIRQTGVRMQFLLRSVIVLPQAGDYEREYCGQALLRVWQECQSLREPVLDLQEYFAAGYLELCRSAQLVKAPSHFDYRVASLGLPSYHAAAESWCSRKIGHLLHILQLESDPMIATESAVLHAASRWEEHEGEILKWAKGITEEHNNAIPLLAMERMHALLNWERVPPTSFTEDERRSLNDAVEDVRARSLGYKCKRCGKPAIVTSAGGKKAVKRYLRCQDRTCGWRGAAAKKVL